MTVSYCCSSAFTLHGLWPEYEDERGVFTCKRRYKDQFYPDCCKTAKPPGPLPPASDEMRCKWESFKDSDTEFWEYEWGASMKDLLLCRHISPNNL